MEVAMIKNLSTLEVKIGERVYKLLCETESTWGELHDVLYQMKNFVVQRINEIHRADDASKDAQLASVEENENCTTCKFEE
jgi:hypothetical protein